MENKGKAFIIAVTGGIGSGKSLLSHFTESLGAHIIDADVIAHGIQDSNSAAAEAIKTAFGEKYYENGKLNRRLLGEAVFSDKEKLDTLNGIMHPLVFKEIGQRIDKAKNGGAKVILVVIPLLFETAGELLKSLDAVWIIRTKYDDCVQRIMKRDNCNEEYAKIRISSQMTFIERTDAAKRAGIPFAVINNMGSEETFKKNIIKALKPRLACLKSG